MENEVELIEPQVEVIEPVVSGAQEITEFIEKESMPDEKFYYTILAPKSFRPNADFNLNFSIHDAKCAFDEEILIRVSIEDEDNEAGFKVHRDIVMKPNVTELVTIPVGDISIDHNYKLVVKGISGITLERQASLDLQTQTHSILIQSDKAIYKPNDCIKFRVLVLDAELKAAAINNNDLSIGIAVSFIMFFFFFVCNKKNYVIYAIGAAN